MQTHELVGRYSLERASSGFLAAVMLSLPLGTTVAQIFLFGESAVPWIAAMSFYGVMLVGHLALKAMKVPNLRAHQSINPVVAYRQMLRRGDDRPQIAFITPRRCDVYNML